MSVWVCTQLKVTPFFSQERNSLLEELLRCRQQDTLARVGQDQDGACGDVLQVKVENGGAQSQLGPSRTTTNAEDNHLRLCLLEDKIKEVMSIIRSLNESVSTR